MTQGDLWTLGVWCATRARNGMTPTEVGDELAARWEAAAAEIAVEENSG